MARTEAQKAVADHLAKKTTVTRREGRPSPSGWTSSTVYAGSQGADTSTIEFVKTKVFPVCELHQVNFANHEGRSMGLLVKTWQNDDGTLTVWPVGGGEGGNRLRRSRPWVNFAAGFGADGFVGGGWVIGDGSEQASSVRLAFANGVTIEDTVDRGVVLFFEPRRVVTPAIVDILDGKGLTLVTYQEFGSIANTA